MLRGALRFAVVDEQGSRSSRVAALALAVTATSTTCSLLSQVMVAAVVGAQASYDAYVVATSVPIGLSAMTHFGVTYGLVPRLAAAAIAEARDLGSAAFTMLALAGLGVSTGLWVLSPQLVGLLAPGFSAHTAAMAALMMRIALVGLAFDVARSVLVAVNVASGRAVLAQFANVVWFTVWPLAVWAAYPRLGPISLAGAYAVAHATIFALLLASAVRARLVEVRPRGGGRALGELVGLTLPAAVALLAMQAGPFVDRAVGSLLPGPTISYLTYATRPSDLFARGAPQALGLVFFPLLARHAAARDWRRLRQVTADLLRLALLVAALAAVILMVLRHQVLTLLYVHGAFGSGTAETVAGLLRWYAAAIVPLSVLSVLTFLLCGLRAWRPLLVLGTLSAGTGAILDVALSRLLLAQGIAISAFCVACLTALGAGLIAGRAVPGILNGVSAGWLLRVAGAAMATLLLGTALERVLPAPHGPGQTLALLVPAGAGLAGVFVVALTALRVPQTYPLLAVATRLLGHHI